MIHYPIDWAEFTNRVVTEVPGWLETAGELTEENRKEGTHVSKGRGHWWKVKYLFIALQHGKCGWCERRPEGLYEFDVEHIRPKNIYPLLAYQLQNYAVACKTCNSALKRSQYPLLSGQHAIDSIDALEVERRENSVLPTLLFANIGTRPEALITFDGILPIPASAAVAARASVVIRLLGLSEREILWRERAVAILQVWSAFVAWQTDRSHTCYVAVRDAVASGQPHAGCRRAFLKRCLLTRDRAEATKELCERYVGVAGRGILSDRTHSLSWHS